MVEYRYEMMFDFDVHGRSSEKEEKAVVVNGRGWWFMFEYNKRHFQSF